MVLHFFVLFFARMVSQYFSSAVLNVQYFLRAILTVQYFLRAVPTSDHIFCFLCDVFASDGITCLCAIMPLMVSTNFLNAVTFQGITELFVCCSYL